MAVHSGATTPPVVAPPTPMTVDYALANAARLLLNAELETDLLRMKRDDELADSWIGIALVAQHQPS